MMFIIQFQVFGEKIGFIVKFFDVLKKFLDLGEMVVDFEQDELKRKFDFNVEWRMEKDMVYKQIVGLKGDFVIEIMEEFGFFFVLIFY